MNKKWITNENRFVLIDFSGGDADNFWVNEKKDVYHSPTTIIMNYSRFFFCFRHCLLYRKFTKQRLCKTQR